MDLEAIWSLETTGDLAGRLRADCIAGGGNRQGFLPLGRI